MFQEEDEDEDRKLTKATLAAFLPAVEEVLKQKSDIFGANAKVNSDRLHMRTKTEVNVRSDVYPKWVVIEGVFPIETPPHLLREVVAARDSIGTVSVSNQITDDGSSIRFKKTAHIYNEDIRDIVAYVYLQPEVLIPGSKGRRETLCAGGRDYYLRWFNGL